MALIIKAAKHTYVSAQGTFMIHKSYFMAQPGVTATKAKAMSENLMREDERVEAIIKAHANIPVDVWATHALQDVTFTAQDAVKYGIAQKIGEWQVPAGSQIFNI